VLVPSKIKQVPSKNKGYPKDPALYTSLGFLLILQENAMSKRSVFTVVILTLLTAEPAVSQRLELVSIPKPAPILPVSSNVGSPDAELLRSTANWISSVFRLPELQELPDIRRFPSGKFVFVSTSGIVSDRLPDTAVVDYRQSGREIAAHYDDSTKTIYLPESWDDSTPAQMSVLVHAMTHHFQRLSRKYYDCPQERKALPYEAQERWLGLYDRSLLEDFRIEPATLMLITQCVP
jgi:hypothetical protein